MADMPSFKLVHSSPYKGGTQKWSNRHHFAGGTPANLTDWTSLINAVVTAEKLCTGTPTTYVEAVCYEAGSDLPLHTVSLSGTGSQGIPAGYQFAPLEAVALVRWSTDQRSVKNHPIYLFSYLHNMVIQEGTPYEQIRTIQKTAIDTYAAAWVSGFTVSGNTYKRAGPRGAVALGAFVDTFVTHRDFT